MFHAVAALVTLNGSGTNEPDFDRYYEIGSTAGRPYVDYPVEHPIGTLLIFKALARTTGGRGRFAYGVIALNVVADIAIVAALYATWGAEAAACYALVVAPILGLFFARVDPWSTSAATIAIAAWRRHRPAVLGAALAVGAAFKLWPLVFVPMLLVPDSSAPSPARSRAIALASFGATAAVLGATALGIAGSSAVMQVLTFRGARGWQIESVVGNLLQLTGAASLRVESGSWRIGATSGPISIGLFLAAAPACLWSTWRGARAGAIGTAWLAAVSALLLLSALFSAQFVIWLTPAAAIAWVERDRLPAALAIAAVEITQLFWTFYSGVIESRTPSVFLVTIRNVVMLMLAAAAFASRSQAARGRTTSPGRLAPRRSP